MNSARWLGATVLVLALMGCGDDSASGNAPDNDAPNNEVNNDQPNNDLNNDDGNNDAPNNDMVGDFELPEPLPADGADPYFAPDRLLEVAIEIAPEDWDALRAQSRTLADILGGDCLDGPRSTPFSWFSATVTVDGQRYEDVGIRKKGYLGSLSDAKPSLKVRFDKYVDDQLLDGVLKRLTLNNVQQDLSKMNTCLSYSVFAAAGVPTPRCNMAAVTINGDDYGLFVHVESVKTQFLERHFEDTEGNLYEGTLSDFRSVWNNSFEKKTNEGAADFSDIEAITEVLEIPGPEGIEALGELVDLNAFLTFWATEALVGHWDGYSGNRNNYLIYRPEGGKFAFIPWGPDSSFYPFETEQYDEQGEVVAETPAFVRASGAIAHRLYNDPMMRAAYIDRMRALLELVWDEAALLERAELMNGMIQSRALDFLRPYAANDARRILGFIRERRDQLNDALESEIVDWPYPLDPPDLCWEELGVVDVAFETTWDSLDVPVPLEQGSATINAYTVEGQALTFEQAGVTIGVDPEIDPENDVVRLSIVGQLPGGEINLLNAYMGPDRVGNGEVALDVFRADAFRIILRPPRFDDFEFYGRISGGAVVFDEATATPGATVRGRLYGKLYSFGGYTSGEGQDNHTPPAGPLVINEVAARGEPLDWVEIYNASDEPVELSDFVIADDLLIEAKRVPLESGVIEPGQYVQVFLDKDAWPGFSLGQDEAFGIWDSNGTLIDSVEWSAGQSDAGTSFARSPDATGRFQTTDNPSPAAPNP